MARTRPLGLDLRTWGGKRKGAGRKPAGARAGVPHQHRPALSARHPVHVTLRVLPHVWNLRSRRAFRAIGRAFVSSQLIGRSGKVFADRFHAHGLRTPLEVARAVDYVLGNFVVHAVRRGGRARPQGATADPYSSAGPEGRLLTAPPRTWLLRDGWLGAKGRSRSRVLSARA